MDETQLLDLKRSLTSGLLAIPGVSGIGVGADRLHVYLVNENSEIRKQVQDIIRAKNPEANVEFIVTGNFLADK